MKRQTNGKEMNEYVCWFVESLYTASSLVCVEHHH